MDTEERREWSKLATSRGHFGLCKICGKKNKEGYGKNHNFCSQECYGKSVRLKSPERNRVCKQCSTKFTTNPAYIRRRKTAGIYCTRECFNKSIENKEGFLDRQGYRCVMLNGKRKRMHRVVMETHLGRELKTVEHVHHIDGNKLNNSINNLYLTSNSNHQKAHASMENVIYKLLEVGIVAFKGGVYTIEHDKELTEETFKRLRP